MSELPNPVNFDAATSTVTVDDVKRQFACGPDPERHLQVVKQFADAGFDHIVLENAGSRRVPRLLPVRAGRAAANGPGRVPRP